MIDNINFVILCIIIVILLVITSGVIFLYKVINSIRQEKIKQIFKNYNKNVYDVITGKKNVIDSSNIYILSDVINIYYSWVHGEKKTAIYSFEEIEFF
jgi:hypothetical protein